MIEFTLSRFTGDNENLTADLGIEIHALSSATKPLCSWIARDAIQECRESCGGHGFLKSKDLYTLGYFNKYTYLYFLNNNHLVMLLVSRLGDIRAENDANCTYEGENNLLVQQASNWLLSQWTNVINGRIVLTPLGSADFLVDTEQILNTKFDQATVEDTLKPESMIKKFIPYYNKIYNVKS